MKKRLVCLLILLCLACNILCACASPEITDEQAVNIMLEDLGEDAKNTSNLHIHTSTFENEGCYNIYFTLNGESWVYIISVDGEILAKGPGGHSH